MTVSVRKYFYDAFSKYNLLFLTIATLTNVFLAKGNAVISASQLPWSDLAKITAEQGRQIVNWPEGVPFAGKDKQAGQLRKKSGIKALTTASLCVLYQAFRDPNTTLCVIPANRAGE